MILSENEEGAYEDKEFDVSCKPYQKLKNLEIQPDNLNYSASFLSVLNYPAVFHSLIEL